MDEKIREIIELACKLIKIQAYSVGEMISESGIKECYNFILSFLKDAGLTVYNFGEGTPGLYCDAGKFGNPIGDIVLCGHYDRVSPQDVSQTEAKIDGDWLYGRGAADMLTVVATYMVFMKNVVKVKIPRIGLLFVGNEESGEVEKWGTTHILSELKSKYNYIPHLLIAGERTGEGAVKIGKVEVKNRGVIRVKLKAAGAGEHTSLTKGLSVTERILLFKDRISNMIAKREGSWKTSFMLSYFKSGEIGNFNTTPERAEAGIEIRPIPEDDFDALINGIYDEAERLSIDCEFVNQERGISTAPSHPFVARVLKAISTIDGKGESEYLGNGKLPGTQARFAPHGCAQIVFGQSGIGPHSKNEAHYIPSIIPYYRVLNQLI